MPPNDPPPPNNPPPRGPVEHIVHEYDHGASRWGLGQAIVGTVLHVLAGLALVQLFASWTGEDPGDLTDVGNWLVPFVAVPPIVVLLYVVWVGRARGKGARQDFHADVERSDVPLGALTALVSAIAAGMVVGLLDSLFGLGTDDAAAVEAAQGSLGSDGITIGLLLFALGAATIVPVSEELLFRGLFWSALEKRGATPWATNLITSIVFSAWHFEPFRFVALTVIGLFLGWTRMRTGRIGAAVVCHVLINALGMAALVAESA